MQKRVIKYFDQLIKKMFIHLKFYMMSRYPQKDFFIISSCIVMLSYVNQ